MAAVLALALEDFLTQKVHVWIRVRECAGFILSWQVDWPGKDDTLVKKMVKILGDNSVTVCGMYV